MLWRVYTDTPSPSHTDSTQARTRTYTRARARTHEHARVHTSTRACTPTRHPQSCVGTCGDALDVNGKVGRFGIVCHREWPRGLSLRALRRPVRSPRAMHACACACACACPARCERRVRSCTLGFRKYLDSLSLSLSLSLSVRVCVCACGRARALFRARGRGMCAGIEPLGRRRVRCVGVVRKGARVSISA